MNRPCARQVAERFVVLRQCVVYALATPPRDMIQEQAQRWPQTEYETFVADLEAQRDRFWGAIKGLGLWESLTPSERELAASTIVTMSETQHINASWRMESASVLLWSLGLVDALPPYDTEASVDLLKHYPSTPVSTFLATAGLRSDEVIERERGIAELWHWRSRTRQLVERGDVLPAHDLAGQHVRSFGDVVRITAKIAFDDGTLPQILDDDFVAFGKPYRSLSPKEWAAVTSISSERHFALNWLCGYAPDNHWDDTPTDT
jgi:hypothetical protein